MIDPRLRKLAGILVNYSVKAKAGEKVLIQDTNVESLFVSALVDAVYDAGAMPFVTLRDKAVERTLFRRASAEQLDLQARFERDRMKEMDCFIGFSSILNMHEWSDIPEVKQELWETRLFTPVHMEERIKNTRWVVLRYPSPAMAQLSSMSTEAFEDFYFDVCTLDYGRMSKAMDKLTALMDRTDRVRIVGPGTDLSFSIKGLPRIKCAGKMNIPDGEVYTAPVRDSVEGTITYNAPSEYRGFVFERLRLEFRQGRIVEATANDTARAKAIFDTDEGARYVGEFAIGVNPYITKPMLETLFDEKIAGSIHFTPGNAYDDCWNGNKSAIHWDLVLMQDAASGGGEIYFDGKLIRKDGIFVLPELLCLNPEELKA